jgi:hypothetical protein
MRNKWQSISMVISCSSLVIAFLMSILMTFPITHFSKMFTSALVLGMGDFESVVQETASLADQKLLRGKNRSLLCLARILHTGHNLSSSYNYRLPYILAYKSRNFGRNLNHFLTIRPICGSTFYSIKACKQLFLYWNWRKADGTLQPI